MQESFSQEAVIGPGEASQLKWALSLPEGATAYRAGLELAGAHLSRGTVYLDSFGWSGSAQAILAEPGWGGAMWRRAWVDGVDKVIPRPREAFRLVQNRGRGLVMSGTREWQDYILTAQLTPQLAESCGIAVRVQGLRRYYGLLLSREGALRLVRVCENETLLGAASLPGDFWKAISLSLQITGQHIQAWVGGHCYFDLVDRESPLDCGGVGLVIEEGCMACELVQVSTHRPVVDGALSD
jgi:hypothetical protein